MGEELFNLREARYRRLTRVISSDPEVRARERRAKLFVMGSLGFFVILPFLFWTPDVADSGAPEFFRRPTPYESHLVELGRSGLGGTDAGRRWWEEGFAALYAPTRLVSSYETAGVLPRGDPLALGLSVHLRTGQRVRIDLEMADEPGARVFFDTYRPAPIPDRLPVPATGTETDSVSWSFEPAFGGDFVLRVQPEYGRAGPYRLSALVEASLAFPVAGRGMGDVGGVFGDPRDGGRRSHRGVDIFAPRGTPVTAAADGRITSVDNTGIGGRVVWLRTADGRHTIYYAHLDRQLVREGQRVQVGDTLGLVGNTGNARTTPPHLHFGVYRRGEGAVDPWYFIAPVNPSGT